MINTTLTLSGIHSMTDDFLDELYVLGLSHFTVLCSNHVVSISTDETLSYDEVECIRAELYDSMGIIVKDVSYG